MNLCVLHSGLTGAHWGDIVLSEPSLCTTVSLFQYFCQMGVISFIPPECNGCTWAPSSVRDTQGYTHGGRDRCSLSPHHTRPGHGRQENGICKGEKERKRSNTDINETPDGASVWLKSCLALLVLSPYFDTQ